MLQVVREAGSKKSQRAPLPPVGPPCVLVAQAVPASWSTPHSAGRKAHDDRVKNCRPVALLSVLKRTKYWCSSFIQMKLAYNIYLYNTVHAISITALSYKHTLLCYHKRLTLGYICGRIVHPLSSLSPSFGMSRVICSSSNITSWSGPTLASAYLASIA